MIGAESTRQGCVQDAPARIWAWPVLEILRAVLGFIKDLHSYNPALLSFSLLAPARLLS